MHLQALTPLITSLSLAAIALICSRSRHQVLNGADVFTISPVVGYCMIGAGVFFCVAPFLPGAAGDVPTLIFFWAFSPFWLLAFTASAWFFRYQVAVRDSTLTYGAFRRRAVPFSEVIDLDVIKGRYASELWVYLQNGTRLKFSGMLSDFDELVGTINSHMAGLPASQLDSAAKLRDQQNRKRDGGAAGWGFS